MGTTGWVSPINEGNDEMDISINEKGATGWASLIKEGSERMGISHQGRKRNDYGESRALSTLRRDAMRRVGLVRSMFGRESKAIAAVPRRHSKVPETARGSG